MKKSLSLLFLVQIICLSTALPQATSEKPSTNACPDWNKKPISSKAEYFSYLSKRNPAKAKDNSDFYSPKYQNYLANKTSSPASRKKQERSAMASNSGNSEKAKQPAIIPEEKNNSSKSIRESADETKAPQQSVDNAVEKTPSTIAEKGNTVSSSPKDLKKTEANKSNSNTTYHRKHLFSKIALRKKNAASCPEF